MLKVDISTFPAKIERFGVVVYAMYTLVYDKSTTPYSDYDNVHMLTDAVVTLHSFLNVAAEREGTDQRSRTPLI